MNWLQAHYNRAMEAGCPHAMYIAWNDISDETAAKLKAEFDKTHPEGVSLEKRDEFMREVKRENDRAQARDDFEWLTGTGRYGQ